MPQFSSSWGKPTQVKVEGGFKKSHDAGGESSSNSHWASGSSPRDSRFSPVESNRLQICSRLPGTEVYVKDSQHFLSIKREKSEFSHCKTPNFLVSKSPSAVAKSSCHSTGEMAQGLRALAALGRRGEWLPALKSRAHVHSNSRECNTLFLAPQAPAGTCTQHT